MIPFGFDPEDEFQDDPIQNRLEYANSWVETLQDWMEEAAEDFRRTIFSSAETMEAYHLRRLREENWEKDLSL